MDVDDSCSQHSQGELPASTSQKVIRIVVCFEILEQDN